MYLCLHGLEASATITQSIPYTYDLLYFRFWHPVQTVKYTENHLLQPDITLWRDATNKEAFKSIFFTEQDSRKWYKNSFSLRKTSDVFPSEGLFNIKRIRPGLQSSETTEDKDSVLTATYRLSTPSAQLAAAWLQKILKSKKQERRQRQQLYYIWEADADSPGVWEGKCSHAVARVGRGM